MVKMANLQICERENLNDFSCSVIVLLSFSFLFLFFTLISLVGILQLNFTVHAKYFDVMKQRNSCNRVYHD